MDSFTIAVFQEETDLPFGKQEIDVADNTVFQVAEKVKNFGPKDVNLDTNFESGGINISNDLHRILVIMMV
jgi:hypothetical protein